MDQLAYEFRVGDIENPTGYGSEASAFGSLLTNTTSAVTIIAGILLFVYLIYGGVRYLTAAGDEKAVKEAQRIITNAVIGLVIIVVAYFVTEIAATVLGFGSIFEIDFPSPEDSGGSGGGGGGFPLGTF